MPSLIDNVLGSGRTTNDSPAPPVRSALALGTVGRLGEELINCLLESPHYAAVKVGVEAPMQSMLQRLQPWLVPAAALSEVPGNTEDLAFPRVDDVFCCFGDARSHFKRDQAYVMLRKEHILKLAQLAAGSGALHLIVIAPLSAFLQLTATASGLIDTLESQLAGIGFESLIIVRPAADYAKGRGNVIERLIAWGAKATLQIMIPPGLQPLRARQIAQAAVNAAQLLGPGVHIVGAEQIAALATPGVPVKAPRRRF
jgi:hypothetical protein